MLTGPTEKLRRQYYEHGDRFFIEEDDYFHLCRSKDPLEGGPARFPIRAGFHQLLLQYAERFFLPRKQINDFLSHIASKVNYYILTPADRGLPALLRDQ